MFHVLCSAAKMPCPFQGTEQDAKTSACSFFLGWLMVVQLFVTLGFIFSFVGQLILVALLLRFPLEVILRFEYHFCGLAFLCNAVTGMLPDLELKESFHNFFSFLQHCFSSSPCSFSDVAAGLAIGCSTPTTTTSPGASPSPSSLASSTFSRLYSCLR